MAKQSQAIFSKNRPVASNDDDAAQLTTSFSRPVGLTPGASFALDLVATFSSETDEVIIQKDQNGVISNWTYGWSDFVGNNKPFVAGSYRLVDNRRSNGIDGLRVGLSTTCTDVYVSVGPVM